MKLRTLINASVTVSAVLVVFVALALTRSMAEVREALSLSLGAEELVKGITELRFVATETIIYAEGRSQEQWRRRHESMLRFLASGSLSGLGQEAALDRIRVNHARLDTLYSRLTESANARSSEAVEI